VKGWPGVEGGSLKGVSAFEVIEKMGGTEKELLGLEKSLIEPFQVYTSIKGKKGRNLVLEMSSGQPGET